MTLRSCSPLLAATTVTKPQPHSRSGSCLLTSWMRLQALSWEFALKPAKSFKIISTTTSGQRVETWWQLWHLRIVFFWGLWKINNSATTRIFLIMVICFFVLALSRLQWSIVATEEAPAQWKPEGFGCYLDEDADRFLDWNEHFETDHLFCVGEMFTTWFTSSR